MTNIRGERPQIPDVAYDMHTKRGQEMGRGLEHFLKEGALVENERPGRDTTYRERLLESDRGRGTEVTSTAAGGRWRPSCHRRRQAVHSGAR